MNVVKEGVLGEAISKALANGWDRYSNKCCEYDKSKIRYYDIIYNHDFAKALWGEKPLGWRYHLQMMVVADDPIEYLGEHLDA